MQDSERHELCKLYKPEGQQLVGTRMKPHTSICRWVAVFVFFFVYLSVYELALILG